MPIQSMRLFLRSSAKLSPQPGYSLTLVMQLAGTDALMPSISLELWITPTCLPHTSSHDLMLVVSGELGHRDTVDDVGRQHDEVGGCEALGCEVHAEATTSNLWAARPEKAGRIQLDPFGLQPQIRGHLVHERDVVAIEIAGVVHHRGRREQSRRADDDRVGLDQVIEGKCWRGKQCGAGHGERPFSERMGHVVHKAPC